MQTIFDPDNILIIPPAPPASSYLNTQTPVLEDVIVMPSTDSVSLSGAEADALRFADAPLSAEASPEQSAHAWTPQADATGFVSAPDAEASQPLRKSKSLPAARDKYSLGVQLLHVSPVWLLVGGLAFVALIATGNWLIRPALQANAAAPRVTNNQATNQSVKTSPTSNALTAKTQAASSVVANAPVQASESRKSAVEVKEKQAAETKAVEAKAEAAAVVSHQSGKQESGKFTLQIGSFNDMAEAQNHASSLQAAGMEGRVVSAEIPKRGTWYRVQVGRFPDRDEATRFISQLRAKGVAQNAIVTEVQP
jgi:cell division septation protein DedD